MNVRTICLIVPPIAAFSFGGLIKSNYMELNLFSRCFTLKEQRTSLLPAPLLYSCVINIYMRVSVVCEIQECSMTYRQSKMYKSQRTSKLTTTTVCFIQKESLGCRQISKNPMCIFTNFCPDFLGIYIENYFVNKLAKWYKMNECLEVI